MLRLEIDVEGLRGDGSNRLAFEEQVALGGVEYRNSKLEVEGGLEVEGDAYFEEGTIQVTLDFNLVLIRRCSRCLEPIEKEIVGHEVLEFRPGMEREISSEGNVSIYKYSGEDKIDLLPYLLRFIRLSLEPYPLCKSDCQGLCPVCGANLNEEEDHDCQEEEEGKAKDPRFEKLADLL